MKLPLFAGLCAAATLAAALAAAMPSYGDGIPWLFGDTVQVAAHRFNEVMQPSSHPLIGYLARPNAPGRHPAVVELHGCGGFGTFDVAAADVLKPFGYAALALDSLGRYNACASPADAALAEAFDAYAALGWLVRQSFVDPDRVALIGFSMGGIATLFGVERGSLEKSRRRRFRAAIAFYPRCRFFSGVMTVPTLILVGDKDDWTPASMCRDMMARRGGKGAPVKLIVYPGATHAFNFPFRPRRYLGHRFKYDPEATAAAWKEVRDFLRATLGPADGRPAPGGAALR